MDFKREIIVDKPIAEVWEILGNQYGDAYKWASGLYYSEGLGNPSIEGAKHDDRACDTSQGKIKEKIRTFDPENHVLAYEVIEGFPSFVDSALNTWTLSAQDSKTKVQMHLVMRLKGILGTLMSPMMRLQLGPILTNAVQDFKHYVDTGKPSPRKAKEIAKQLQKAAA